MTLNTSEIVERYVKWLHDNIKVQSIKDNTVSLQAPFLDAHNDFIKIYIKKLNNGFYYLTDDGRTFYDLETSGFSLTKLRQETLSVFLNRIGLDYNKSTQEIFVRSDWENLPQKKNDLIQGILNIGDMFLVSEPNVRLLFFEDVATYFTSQKIAYNANVWIEGKASGIKHKVDFLIPRVGKSSVIVETLSNPKKDRFGLLLFKFYEISASKTEYAKAEKVLVINDQEKPVKQSYIEMVKSYDVKPVLWSQKEEMLNIVQE